MRSPTVHRTGPRSIAVFLPGLNTYGRSLWLEWRPTDRLAGIRAWTDSGGRRYAIGAWWARLDVLAIPLRDHEAAWLDRFTRR